MAWRSVFYTNPTPRTDFTYETRCVLAGAYKAHSPKSMLTHVVEIDTTGREIRVLCKRVDLNSIADHYAGVDVHARATCQVCAKRDPRLMTIF